MKRKTKLWIQLIAGIILLLLMFCIPEFGAAVLIVMLVVSLCGRLWHVPVGTLRKKR